MKNDQKCSFLFLNLLHTLDTRLFQNSEKKVWEELTLDGVIPNIDTESQCRCVNMVTFMDRFDKIIDKNTSKKVLSKVRHGMKPSQSAWAREKFLKIGNLDEFIKQSLDESISHFEKLYIEKTDFYGDIITKEVLDFLKTSPSTLAGVRDGDKIIITAFPANMQKYLTAADSKMKRYYACHCPFAKESILAEKTVSSTLCYCSFGHVKNFWEAVFDRELDGEVLTSALKGDIKCEYFIYIPDDIMTSYVG